jgi:hypothetical protein
MNPDPIPVDKEEQQRLAKIVETTLSVAGKQPRLLYHYTTPRGLTEILKNRSLWASNSLYLNDAREMIQASDVAKTVVAERLPKSSGRYATFLRGLADSIANVVKWEPAYVTSFTANSSDDGSDAGDSVDQWRGYASKYCGFSIGFRFSDLSRRLRERGLGQIRPCVYGATQQSRIVRLILDLYKPVAEADKTDDCGASITAALVPYAFTAPLFKHDSLKGESEWRIVVQRHETGDNVLIRPTATRIIPYLELKLAETVDDLPVSRIVVGPSPAAEDNQRALHTYLQANDARLHVDKSQVPYRGW